MTKTKKILVRSLSDYVDFGKGSSWFDIYKEGSNFSVFKRKDGVFDSEGSYVFEKIFIKKTEEEAVRAVCMLMTWLYPKKAAEKKDYDAPAEHWYSEAIFPDDGSVWDRTIWKDGTSTRFHLVSPAIHKQ